jgi:hypothetical protein
MGRYSKLLLFFGLIAVLMLGESRVVKSQEEPTAFEVAYQEYKDTVEDYQGAHDAYVLAKAQYLRFKTQKSKEEAYDATLKMLQERDNIFISYYEAMKERLFESDGLSDTQRDDLLVEIDAEIAWYTEHRENLSSTTSLDDLVDDSRDAERQYDRFTTSTVYKSLSFISYSKYNVLAQRLDELFEDLKEKIEEIRTEDRDEYRLSDERLQSIDSWVLESERHVVRSNEKENLVVEYANGTAKRGQVDYRTYTLVLDTLGDTRLLLKETTNYLKEIIRLIKTKEQTDGQ